MKRLTVALAAIGLTASCGAFAAFPANTDPTLVAVPQLPGGFVIGLTGVYMQPTASNGDTDWADLATLTGVAPNVSTASTVQQVDPGYNWGGAINVGYIFPGSGNDVNLSYFYYSSDDSSNTAVGDAAQLLVPTNSINGDFFTSGSSKAEYTLNQVDLTFGQFINVGCHLVLHPFAGARFASLERKLSTSLNDGAVATTESIDEKSSFSGVGPLAGVDASYYVWNGIGVVGHFDSALLVGSIDVDNTDNTFNAAGAVVTSDTLNADNTNRVVPVVDAALGLDYTWLFNNADNSDLTLELGWKATNYFNAVDRTYFATGASASSDFGLNGPYVSLTFHA